MEEWMESHRISADGVEPKQYLYGDFVLCEDQMVAVFLTLPTEEEDDYGD